MQIGNATFKSKIQRNQVNKGVFKTLQSNTTFWAIDHQRYNEQNWKNVFLIMEDNMVDILILDYNSRPTIVKEISHINFLQLKQIWIRENRINNFESIQFLNAPNLELLRVSINHINKLQSLVKIQSRNLSEIYVASNNILDRGWMGRTWLQKTVINVYFEYWDLNNVIFEDMSVLSKGHCQRINGLWLKGEQRILQPKLYQQLKQRFFKMVIYHRNQQ